MKETRGQAPYFAPTVARRGAYACGEIGSLSPDSPNIGNEGDRVKLGDNVIDGARSSMKDACLQTVAGHC